MEQSNHCQKNWPYGCLHIERKQEGKEYLEKKCRCGFLLCVVLNK
jgi:hypothetical protein